MQREKTKTKQRRRLGPHKYEGWWEAVKAKYGAKLRIIRPNTEQN
jgi:hypothetical protein